MLTPSIIFGSLACVATWHACALTSWFATGSPAPLLAADGERLARLRQMSSTFRWFGTLAVDLGRFSAVRWLAREKSVALSLSRGAMEAPFTPQELIGTRAIEGIVIGAALAMLWHTFGGGTLTMVALGLGAPPAYLMWSTHALKRKAQRRMFVLSSRLPFAIDSLALMLEAGANIDEALDTVSKAAPEHPVSKEFTRLRHEMQRGITFRAAVEKMDERLKLPAVQEFAGATLVAYDLGTPLKQVLNQLAEQMRMRQSQDVEGAAGRAQVQLIQPATLMLVAAMAMVVAPFLMPVLASLAHFK